MEIQNTSVGFRGVGGSSLRRSRRGVTRHYKKNSVLNSVKVNLNHKFSRFPTELVMKNSVSVGDENTDHRGMTGGKMKHAQGARKTPGKSFPCP